MRRHAEQVPELVSRVVVLDYDGAAKVAGEIFDEPGIARPLAGDELNAVLPERFFVLQDALRSGGQSSEPTDEPGHLISRAQGRARLRRTTSTCASICTWSPTTTPPTSRSWFQRSPKSRRSRRPFTE